MVWHGLEARTDCAQRYQVDAEALRVRLRGMSDAELLELGKAMHDLVYPLRYGGDGKPSVSTFSIQLDEARLEWLRRHRSNHFAQ